MSRTVLSRQIARLKDRIRAFRPGCRIHEVVRCICAHQSHAVFRTGCRCGERNENLTVMLQYRCALVHELLDLLPFIFGNRQCHRLRSQLHGICLVHGCHLEQGAAAAFVCPDDIALSVVLEIGHVKRESVERTCRPAVLVDEQLRRAPISRDGIVVFATHNITPDIPYTVFRRHSEEHIPGSFDPMQFRCPDMPIKVTCTPDHMLFGVCQPRQGVGSSYGDSVIAVIYIVVCGPGRSEIITLLP